MCALRLNPVAPHRRQYVRSHPVVFWFSIGISLIGIAALIDPSLTGESSAALALPPWLRAAFNIVWAVGGAASTIGIARGYPKLEAAGMSLLASGLFANFLATVYIRSSFAISALFVLTLAIGCAMRAHYLASPDPERS